MYYDEKQRLIQVVGDNYKGGTERTTNVVDFTGKILRTRTTHVDYDVTWTDLVSVNPIGNKIVSTQSTSGFGNSGVASMEKLPAATEGWVEVTVNETTVSPGTNTRWILGLSTSNPNAQVTSIQYGIGVNDGWLSTNHGSVMINHVYGVARGDVLKIARAGSTVTFYRNGTQFHSVNGASTGSLVADAALFHNGSSFVNVRASFAKRVDSVMRWFDYDHAGRLKKIWHKFNDGAKVLLVTNEYNAIGQLVNKNLHSEDNGETGRQSVDYRYNIRGWLTSINGSELEDGNKNAEAPGQKKDLFGMDLLYNTVEAGLDNAGLFNGNISAMRWSSNLGMGDVKEHAYTYGYDAMNRLTSAGFRRKSNAWQVNTTKVFSESGYTYDLNGNIKSLTRRGSDGERLDSLSYDYGTETARSNRLFKVSDSGDKLRGFVDGANMDNDYGYDANGNMVFDQNKRITTAVGNIVYNHLNLAEMVNRGGAKLYYAYDATGRKLSQTALFTGTGTKRTDYVGEIEYENDRLTTVNTEEGRVVFSGREEIYKNTFDDLSAVTAVNASADITTINGERYVRVVARSTASGTGLFPVGDGIEVSAGERYLVRAKGYQTSAATAYIHAEVNGTTIDWPKMALPNRERAASWAEQVITILPGDTLLQVGLTWPSAVLGETYHLNELEVIRLTNSAPEYQYHLKDHLGNVRMTFTTKEEKEEVTATLENNHIAEDQANFLNYDNARVVNSVLFDRTNGAMPGYAQRLSGSEEEKIGLAKSFSVMPGDTIRAEVYTKYFDVPDSINTLPAVLQGILALLGNPATSGGQVVDGVGYGTGASTGIPWASGMGDQDDEDAPKAFLNYIWINLDLDTTSIRVKYAPVTTAARETGSNGDHEPLWLEDIVTEAGYVYVYLSNDGEEEREVYFDDFKVEHVKSPVISSQDYYPFGLTFNSYSRENSLTNQYRFQGQEHQDELDLGWDSFKWRNHLPDIGRFFNVDPLSEKYVYNSPYAFSENKVISHRELEGLEAEPVNTQTVSNINVVPVWKNGNHEGHNVTFTLTQQQTATQYDENNVATGTVTTTSTSVHTIGLTRSGAPVWLPSSTPQIDKQNSTFMKELPVKGSTATVTTTTTPVSTNGENPKSPTTTTSIQNTGTVTIGKAGTQAIRNAARKEGASLLSKYFHFITGRESKDKPENKMKYRQDVIKR